MTKKLTTLLMLLTLCLSTCALTSCGDDDDNNASGNASFDINLLIGGWQSTAYSSYRIYFGANGHGHEEEDHSGSDDWYESFTYTVSGYNLTYTYDDTSLYDNPDWLTKNYVIKSITSTRLVLVDDEGDSETFTKID